MIPPVLSPIKKMCWAITVAGLLLLPDAAGGQLLPVPAGNAEVSKPLPSTSQLTLVAEIEELKAENARALRIAQKSKEAKEAKETPEVSKAETPLSDAAAREIELRTQLGYTLDQLKIGAEREAQLRANLAQQEADLNALRTSGPTEEKPYSFLLLERMRDQLAAENIRAESTQAVQSTAREARARAKTLLEEKQSARRKAKEALETKKTDASAGPLEAALQSAELEVRVAEETVRLREVESHVEVLQEQLRKLRQKFLEEKVAILEQEVRFSRDDLQEQKLLIEKRQEDLNQALVWAERRVGELERRRAEAANRLENQTEKDPALPETTESYRIGRLVREQEVALITAQLQRLARALTVWDQRYSVAADRASLDERMRWQKETEDALDQLTRESRLQAIRQDEVRQDLANVDKKIQSQTGADSAVVEAVRDQRLHLERQLRAFDANSASIESSRRLHQKLLHELVGDAQQFNIQDWLARFWYKLSDAWNYEITSVDERPITIGKIVSGLILLLLGVLFSRWLSRVFAERLFARLRLNQNAIPTLQTVAFYLLVAFFALIALKMVNVPLGALTFLGGAVAIGVGFGSQNILNNFISGLILLAERPVRVGDVIEIDGLMGTVERIGGRSTWIRSSANLEIIVPNSTFLQKNVVNWNLGGDWIRSTVTLGVAYGSQLRDVVRLLRKATADHGQVLKTPEPTVSFRNFGDSALIFDLNYWVSIRSLSDRGKIESDVRFMIDAAFREANISIPFPQRDMHFAAAQPFDVRLLPASAPPEDNG
jgi:small-conductance mechanosensitive channel